MGKAGVVCRECQEAEDEEKEAKRNASIKTAKTLGLYSNLCGVRDLVAGQQNWT